MQKFDPSYIYRDDADGLSATFVSWSQEAMEALLRRLHGEDKPQAEIIVEAARRGGRIERSLVYDIARFPSDRTLRGFTKPPRRIAAQLVSAGQLDPAAAPPLVALYRRGVLASHFQVPHEFVEFLAE